VGTAVFEANGGWRIADRINAGAVGRPVRSLSAAELIVDDVDALAAELASSPFRIIGGPADLSFSDQIRAMQVVGPAREVLYLTQADQMPPAAASLPYSGRRSQACVGAAGELIELIESG